MTRTHTMNTSLSTLIVLLSFVTLVVPVQAQNNPYTQCIAIENNEQRLQCFDDVSGEQFPTTQAAPQSSATTTNNVVPTNNRPNSETFGIREPQITSENADEFSIRVVLTSWRKNPFGKILFTTSDGQVWRQIDSRKVIVRSEHKGATINQSPYGGYRLKLDGQNNLIQVKRIR